MPKLTDVYGHPHTGIVPWAVVGVVTDNVDPDKMGRVRVKFPTLVNADGGDIETFWIRQASPNAGKERGLYAIPEIEDEVMVVFMQGSIDAGVIIGQFWNGKDLPPKDAIDGSATGTTVGGLTFGDSSFTAGSGNHDANDRRVWHSRSGHLLVFDDTSGSETVQLWDKTRKLALILDPINDRIILSNNTGDIVVHAQKDLYLEAGENIKWSAGQKIIGESGQDTEHKAGTNWKVEAGTNIESKAGANAKFESGANYDIKAGANGTYKASAMLDLEGSATASLKGGSLTKISGGMVMIN